MTEHSTVEQADAIAEPFGDTNEVFGGYHIVEARDLDAALELAARMPAACFGGAVEIRPLVER